MKILFICLSNLKFNVMTPYSEPLGGTESAISYLAIELAKKHHVTLMANTEDMLLCGIHHTPVSEDIARFDPDIVIVASAPQAIPAIKKIVPRAKVVLWCHMLPDQPAVAPVFQYDILKEIEHIVYVSERQQNTFVEAHKQLKLANREIDTTDKIKGHVINNAMSPAFEGMFSSADEILAVKQCKGAYTSTPYRGLAILSQIKELPIEVYSSMKVYQGDDTPFEAMYEGLKANDCLELKGSISQAALRDALKEVSFLVYPSIFAECHSIAILEAMAAGLKVITTEAAMSSTEFVDSMPGEGGSVENYAKLLRKNINAFRAHPEEWAAKQWQQVQHVNHTATWARRAVEWDNYLTNLVQTQTLDNEDLSTNVFTATKETKNGSHG